MFKIVELRRQLEVIKKNECSKTDKNYEELWKVGIKRSTNALVDSQFDDRKSLISKI